MPSEFLSDDQFAYSLGAQGYLLKDATPEELVDAVRSLYQGGVALEPTVAAKLLDSLAGQKSNEELSTRELDVLQLLVAGASNKSIAAQLSLSENTVKTHLSHIFRKLGVQSRAEAVSVALSRGWCHSIKVATVDDKCDCFGHRFVHLRRTRKER